MERDPTALQESRVVARLRVRIHPSQLGITAADIDSASVRHHRDPEKAVTRIRVEELIGQVCGGRAKRVHVVPHGPCIVEDQSHFGRSPCRGVRF